MFLFFGTGVDFNNILVNQFENIQGPEQLEDLLPQ